MLTVETVTPVKILGYGPWNENNSKFGEFVRVQVEGEDETRQYTLDKSLNGDRPEPESNARLRLATFMRAQAFTKSDGSLGTRNVEKRKVVAFIDVNPARRAA